MGRWFQNSRGLVIVVLAIATGVLLLAVEPSESFPKGVVVAAGSSQTPVSTTIAGPISSTTTTAARPTLQEGSTGNDVMVLQTQLNTKGYNVGTPDGQFGPGTKTQVIAFQTAKGIKPSDGVVNQITWNALLAKA
ncbi:MAG TPA: peptidoglycan-binding domain-containing protein [Acidimicrobiia bacterium]